MNISNRIGNLVENYARALFSGHRVTQSGGGKFYKLDVTDKLRFIYSAKGTHKDVIRVTKGMLREAEEAARGSRGTGDGYKPAMFIAFTDEDGSEVEEAYVLVTAEDWAEAMTAPPETRPLKPGKGAERLARARAGPMDR